MQPSLAKWTVWRWMNLRAYLRHLLHWQSRSHRSHLPGHQALCNTGVFKHQKWIQRKMSLQGASWQWVGDNNWLTLIIFNDNFIVTTDDLQNTTIVSPLTPVSTECPRIWMLPSLPTRLRSFSGGWHHECDSEQPQPLETHWWPLLQPRSNKTYILITMTNALNLNITEIIVCGPTDKRSTLVPPKS